MPEKIRSRNDVYDEVVVPWSTTSQKGIFPGLFNAELSHQRVREEKRERKFLKRLRLLKPVMYVLYLYVTLCAYKLVFWYLS